MRIEIDIPKEFENHFNEDKFKDSFERIIVALKNSLCTGRYEYETIEMLEKAFEDSKSAYDVDKVVKELELHSFELGTDILPVHYVRLNDAIEIVKQGGVSDASDNVCEWYKINGNAYKSYTHAEIYDSRVFDWRKCPYCEKKIKIVGD